MLAKSASGVPSKIISKWRAEPSATCSVGFIRAGIRAVHKSAAVQYDVVETPKGFHAVNVRTL